MDSTNTADLRISSQTKIHLWGGTTNGTSSPHLTVSNNGNVGIGTASPLTNLHIGSGTAGENLGVKLNRGATTNFFVACDNTKQAYIGVDNTQGFIKMGSLSNHPVAICQNNANAIYIDTSKDVGIGTTSPNNPKQRRIEVTPTTTVSSNAWSTSTGSNGGFDVKNDDSSAHAALGAITCSGVYNRQAVEWDIRGNMTANTWYPIAAMGQLTNWQDETGNGKNDGFSMYFRIYAYDVSAGGPTYLSNAMTERIWVNGYTSNSNQEHRIHVGAWMGHAPNFSPTLYDVDQHYQMRIHHHYSQTAGDSVYTGQPTIEILVKTARTGLTGASSYILNVYGYIG